MWRNQAKNVFLVKIISTDSFISLNGRCATSRYLQVVGSIHDIESYFGIDNTLSLNLQIFTAHWGHLTIILIWVSGNLYHIASNANYSLWVKIQFQAYLQHIIFGIHILLTLLPLHIPIPSSPQSSLLTQVFITNYTLLDLTLLIRYTRPHLHPLAWQ